MINLEPTPPPQPVDTEPTLSGSELARLATLQPRLQILYRDFHRLAWSARKIRIYLTSATRTFDEQQYLYDQGRTRPGPKVTNARPGQSWHNFGLAFDIATMIGLTLRWEITTELGAFGESLGLEWGGAWKRFQDENHFQFTAYGDGDLTLARANQLWPQGYKPV